MQRQIKRDSNMNTYNITDETYYKMIDIVEKGDCYWDCIELEDGCAITFAVKNNTPCLVEVMNEEDVVLRHDFSLSRFNKLANS